MAKNVLGTDLQVCGRDPVTGFFRTGKCDTCGDDVGQHTVCAVMDEPFLALSQERGNDLSTPRPEMRFPGLKPGDRWCVCMSRWIEARDAGLAPKVILEATHMSVLEYVDLADLQAHAYQPT